MKKKIALTLLLFSIISTFILNVGQVSRSIVATTGTANDEDLPIELHIIHIKWTS